MKVQPTWIVALALTCASVAATQTPAPQPPPRAAAPADAAPKPPSDYGYKIDGRRDPFVSLLNRGEADMTGAGKSAAKRPEGVAGLMVNEIVVRGLLQSQNGWVAMVGAPDGKTYTVRTGDQLMDGRVRSISSQVLILLQEVKDPLSLEKQREVRKYLRGGEEVQ